MRGIGLSLIPNLPLSFVDSCLSNKKSFFCFFTLTPSHMWLERPVYRGFEW